MGSAWSLFFRIPRTIRPAGRGGVGSAHLPAGCARPARWRPLLSQGLGLGASHRVLGASLLGGGRVHRRRVFSLLLGPGSGLLDPFCPLRLGLVLTLLPEPLPVPLGDPAGAHLEPGGLQGFLDLRELLLPDRVLAPVAPRHLAERLPHQGQLALLPRHLVYLQSSVVERRRQVAPGLDLSGHHSPPIASTASTRARSLFSLPVVASRRRSSFSTSGPMVSAVLRLSCQKSTPASHISATAKSPSALMVLLWKSWTSAIRWTSAAALAFAWSSLTSRLNLPPIRGAIRSATKTMTAARTRSDSLRYRVSPDWTISAICSLRAGATRLVMATPSLPGLGNQTSSGSMVCLSGSNDTLRLRRRSVAIAVTSHGSAAYHQKGAGIKRGRLSYS